MKGFVVCELQAASPLALPLSYGCCSIVTATAAISINKDGTKEIAKADTVTAKLPKSPQTGDTSNLTLWIALLFISGGALIGTTVTAKKKKQK